MTPKQNITTAKYRKMAWDAHERGEWAKAAKYYELALKHYPKHHAGSQMAIEDKAGLRRLLDEVQREAQTVTRTPAPAAASDMASVPVRLGGGGIAPIPGVGAGVAPAKKRRQPAAKPAAKPRAKKAATPKAKSKAKKTAAKPAKAKNGKPAPELTAAQRKRLNATGSVTVKRGGKFVTITR